MDKQTGQSPGEAQVIATKDEGERRDKHCWTVTLEDDRGRAQVAAYGDSAEEAIVDARRTFAARRIHTPTERRQMQASNAALAKALAGPPRSRRAKATSSASTGRSAR